MLPINLKSINLLRYLLVARVNQPLVVLPSCLSVEIGYVLGTIITERLPTGRVKLWRKMQTAWEEANAVVRGKKQKNRWPLKPPDVSWPLDVAWLPYPVKQSYGQGELIGCELKLFGESASHELFLEMILPVLEEAGVRGDTRWKRPRSLWGRFNMHGVYVARGSQWEPVVEDGRLDFNYRPTPDQWREGLTFGQDLGVSATRLDWLTPYEPLAWKQPKGGRHINPLNKAKENAPGLTDLMLALVDRLDQVAPGWQTGEERQTAVADMLALAGDRVSQNRQVKAPPPDWPGLVWGQQMFPLIPPALLPYLELASMLHIGRHTQFGCGTFRLS